MSTLPNGLIVVCKRDCPTCAMLEPVLGQLAHGDSPLTVYCQDDPTFPATVPHVIDDTNLEISYRNNIEIVPTLIRVKRGKEIKRKVSAQ